MGNIKSKYHQHQQQHQQQQQEQPECSIQQNQLTTTSTTTKIQIQPPTSSEALHDTPPEIIQIIVSYLDKRSTAILSACSRYFYHNLPRFIVPNFNSTYNLNGDYGDVDKPLCSLSEMPLPSIVRSITISVKWKDQGWGNQKGHIMLLVKDGNEPLIKQDLFGVAPHDWQQPSVCLTEDNSELIRTILPGNHLELWRHVGGGGGHQLFITNLDMIVEIEPPRKATQLVALHQHYLETLNPILKFTKAINDSQFSASSEYDYANRTHACYFSRLNEIRPSAQSSAWCAAVNDEQQWIQVDLLEIHKITHLAIQKRADYEQWVTEFCIGISLDGDSFFLVENGKLFAGRPGRIVIHPMENVFGRYVRIFPKDFNEHVSLRWGVNGIPIPKDENSPIIAQFQEALTQQQRTLGEEKNKTNLLLEDIAKFTQNITNEQFEATSEWDYQNRTHASYFCRLNEIQPRGASAWCAGTCDTNQWLQVDLGSNHVITHIAIQRRGDYRQFVKEFQIGVSTNENENFHQVNNGVPFVGKFTITVHLMPSGTVGRFVRIYPKTWEGHISLRWGLLGTRCN